MPSVEKDYSNSSFSQLESDVKNTQSESEIHSLQTEIEGRESQLAPAEVREFYNGAPSAERYNFSVSIARKAMVEAENARREVFGEARLGLDAPVRLTKFEELPESGLDLSEDGTRGVPQIYYKQITQEKGNWLTGSKQVETDEVVVVVRLNNGDSGEGTVVCGIAKQRNGVVDFESSSNIFWNITEADYTRYMSQTRQTLLSGEQDGLNKRAFTGQLTSEQFHKEYKKQNRRTLYEDMDAWDKERGNKREAWRYEDVKKETLDRVNNDYGELLQEAERRAEEITRSTQEALNLNKDEVKGRVSDPIFDNYMYLKDNGFLDKDPELKKRYGYILEDQLGIDSQTLELYESQYRKKQAEKGREESVEERAKRAIDDARARAEEFSAKARAEAEKEKERARSEIEKAKNEVEQRVAQARKELEEKAKEALQEQTDKLKREAESRLAKMQGELDSVGREAKEAQEQLAKAQAEVASQKEISSNLRARIADLEATIQGLKTAKSEGPGSADTGAEKRKKNKSAGGEAVDVGDRHFNEFGEIVRGDRGTAEAESPDSASRDEQLESIVEERERRRREEFERFKRERLAEDDSFASQKEQDDGKY